MAAPKENLLSLERLNSSEKNTFTKERKFCGNKSVNKPVLLQDDPSSLYSQEHLVMHLQQRWQELKEREYIAQQQNKQLLEQFEKAQDTLKEMLARNAAMKIIRMEYERYLEENSPRWQQQLKEKRQAAQKKKMDDYLKSCLKNAEVMKSSAGPPTKPQNPATHQGYSDYNQEGSSHLPQTQTSWLSRSQSQIARFPTRVPPIIPQPYPLYYPAPSPGQYHHPWPRQDLQGRASPQPDYPWYQPPGATGTPSYSEALWGQLYIEEPLRDSGVSQTVGEENIMSRVLSSQKERTVRNSSSHELDVKPVRLSSSHSESSESGRDSSKDERKEERGGRKQRVSSDRERCSPQELPGNSSVILIPSTGVAQSSESNASSEKSLRSSSRRTKRSGDLSVQSPGSQKEAEERTESKGGDSESQDTDDKLGSLSEAAEGEKAGNQNHEEKTSRRKGSGSQREKGSESDSAQNKKDDASETEAQGSSSAEQSSAGEKVKDKTEENLEAEEDGEEKEKSRTYKEQDDSDIEQGDGASAKDATGEEAETSTDDEMDEQGGEEQSVRVKNEGTENRKQSAASPQDEEDGSEGNDEEEDEDSNPQEDEESEEKEEHRSEEDQIDSDDCIVAPQEKRSTQMQIMTKEAAQQQEEDKTESDYDDSSRVSDENDIETLLAPQEETQEKEKYLRAEENPKASFHNMGIFQVAHDKSKTDDPNDSDEFDHFYD